MSLLSGFITAIFYTWHMNKVIIIIIIIIIIENFSIQFSLQTIIVLLLSNFYFLNF